MRLTTSRTLEVAPQEEAEPIREPLQWARGPAADEPSPAGQLYFPDLTRDLHIEIDGDRERTRRHAVPPGAHSVALFQQDLEIARMNVYVPLGGLMSVPLDDFRIDTICTARSPHEELLPETHTRGCGRCGTYGDLAMLWLTRHQSPGGLWSASRYQERCRGKRCDGATTDAGDAESTALALLSYLGAGETHNQGACKETVKAGLKALRGLQDDEGWFVERGDRRGQAIAALAMTEAYGLTGSRLWKQPARAAVRAMLGARPATSPETAALEACVLRSAELAELLPENRDTIRAAALHHLESFALPGPAAPRETALLLAARTLLQRKPVENAALVACADALTAHLSTAIDDGLADTIDPVTTYFTTIGASQLGGPTWKAWKRDVERLVVDTQGHGGSWDPAHDAATGVARSRLTTTTLNMLTLGIYYRHGRIFGSDGR